MNKTDPLLSIKNLKTYFFTEKGTIPAVDGVNINVERGKTIGLVGESGCGKSVTALSIIQLVASPPGKIVAGEINFEDNRNLIGLPLSEIRSIRGKDISMIFQEPMTSLNPVYTVGKQVSEVFSIHQSIEKKDIKEKVINMFKMVGIPEPAKRFNSYPYQLSGGLRQRVMIAMALCCKPKLLIADEPTTALDVTIQAQILKLIRELQKESNTSMIMITHDLGVIAEVSDDVYVMYTGRIVEHADVFELFDHPLHPYTLGLMKSIPKVSNQTKDKELFCIEGMVPNLLYMPKGCKFYPRCMRRMAICKEKEPELMQVGDNHLVRCWLFR